MDDGAYRIAGVTRIALSLGVISFLIGGATGCERRPRSGAVAGSIAVSTTGRTAPLEKGNGLPPDSFGIDVRIPVVSAASGAVDIPEARELTLGSYSFQMGDGLVIGGDPVVVKIPESFRITVQDYKVSGGKWGDLIDEGKKRR